jgi:hypothetical protein
MARASSPLSAYQAYADALEAGFIAAADFLNEQKIIWHRDVPYPPQIVALASTMAILGDVASTAAAKGETVNLVLVRRSREAVRIAGEPKRGGPAQRHAAHIRPLEADRPREAGDVVGEQFGRIDPGACRSRPLRADRARCR